MALRGFIGVGSGRIQNDVILPRLGESRFFEVPSGLVAFVSGGGRCRDSVFHGTCSADALSVRATRQFFAYRHVFHRILWILAGVCRIQLDDDILSADFCRDKPGRDPLADGALAAIAEKVAVKKALPEARPFYFNTFFRFIDRPERVSCCASEPSGFRCPGAGRSSPVFRGTP